MNILVLGVVLFVISLFVLELFLYASRIIRYPDRKKIRKRLSVLDSSDSMDSADPARNLLKNRTFSDVPFLNKVLPFIPGILRLDELIRQADLQATAGFFMILGAFLGLTGFLLGSVLTRNPVFSLMIAVALGSLPFLYVLMKKKKRMAKFEKQLPDALGLIARALQAGHAFTSAMKFASEEFDDPLGPEFDETLDEINFGLSVPDALKNLSRRVDCPDLKFFVVSVILQRETGGSLAEIIEGLASLIRERFKFRGKVRTLTAEGRMTAIVLVAIPILMFIGLYMINRPYVQVLLDDPIGNALLAGAAVMMVVGTLIIRRIINVDV